MAAVLQDPGLQRTIERLTRAGQGDEQLLQKRAGEYFLKIASNYNERWLHIWEQVLRRIWRAIYDDFVFDQGELTKIREISRKMPFVLIPCHRSHVDYLIFSYILYKNGIPLPHVAAGDNMDFWPLGYIFRESGAFFLRRSFGDDDLYAAVFATYVKVLLREGVPIEFFIEGGRSRTGKMVTPKYGMLSMIIRAYQERGGDDLALIPVYLGYDRIIEEHAYLNELRGREKRQESILDVLKSCRIMGRRYGKVYLNIGEPLFLKSYFSLQPKLFADMTRTEQQELYRNIGHLVVREINRISVATPLALVAAALLCHSGKEIQGDVLTATVATLYDYLNHKRVNYAPALARREEAVPAALGLFSRWGYLLPKSLQKEKKEFVTSYLLPDDKRLNLEYYKNTIIHHFLPISMAALSICSSREEETAFSRIKDDCLFLKRLFSQEFIFGGDEDREITESLAYREGQGIIRSEKGNVVWKKEGAKQELRNFAGLIRSCME